MYAHTHLVDCICVHSHTSARFLAQPLRLGGVESVFELPVRRSSNVSTVSHSMGHHLPGISALDIVRFPNYARVRLNPNDDVCDCFRWLPVEIRIPELVYQVFSHFTFGDARTDRIDSN